MAAQYLHYTRALFTSLPGGSLDEERSVPSLQQDVRQWFRAALRASVDLLFQPVERTMAEWFTSRFVSAQWGCRGLELSWIANCDFSRRIGLEFAAGSRSGSELTEWIDLARSCGWFWRFPGLGICSERPAEIHTDAQGRLHKVGGPAVRFRDNFGIYVLHGVRVPASLVDQVNQLSVWQIDGERNVEVRRALIEHYGQERYMSDSNGRVVHSDECGKLWKRGGDGEAMVQVVNATPERDGSFREYWLRVPPHIQTAREAVAWTFGMRGKDYAPVEET
jgi:hypothetical protein